MSTTRELVNFITDLKFDDLPETVVEKTKLCLLNIIGVSLAGYSTRIGQLHIELAKECGGGRDEATIIGDGTKVSTPFAAYVNGNLGFALDYEDTVRYIIHPGYITMGAGLAVGEKQNSSGKDLITAIIAGYEIGSRIAVAMQPTPERGTQVWGEQYHPFVAAATAGKLLNLSNEQMDSAFGVAGTYATVPSVYKYFGIVDETRPMREVKMGWGWMCMAGVMAALSANKGFSGGHGMLDGEQGFWIMAGSDRCDFETITAGLMQEWMILETEYKIHPSIAWNHPAFHAANLLVNNHNISADDVAAILIEGMMTPTIGDTSPAGAVDAQFSLPYTVASTIMQQPLLPAMYADEALQDKTMQRLLSVTTVKHNAQADAAFFNEQKMQFKVAIKTKSGDELVQEVEFPKDQPEFGEKELIQKYTDLANTCLSTEQTEKLKTSIMGLENLSDISQLNKLLY